YTLVISPVSCPAITVSPAALLTATRGSAFTQTITASGGTTPYTFSVAGGSLPAGVNLSNGGMLSGTPTLPGNFDFTVKVIDETGCMGSVNYLLIVACPTIIISPSSLPGGVLNVAYSQTLAASSNTASTFTFSLAAGNLPAGLTLSLGGIISGTPTQAGNFPITVRAADTSGCTGTLTYTLTINIPTPALSGINPSSAVAGSAAFTLSVTGSNFVNGATVQWNGANRTTSFVNNTQLTAMIPASDLTAATTASVRVVNPAPSAGPSNALPFTVIAPVTADLVITQSATPNHDHQQRPERGDVGGRVRQSARRRDLRDLRGDRRCLRRRGQQPYGELLNACGRGFGHNHADGKCDLRLDRQSELQQHRFGHVSRDRPERRQQHDNACDNHDQLCAESGRDALRRQIRFRLRHSARGARAQFIPAFRHLRD